MESIEQRIQRLEESRVKTIQRTLTDAELAVRIANLQPSTPTYEAVWAIIDRHKNNQNLQVIRHWAINSQQGVSGHAE